PALIRVLIHIGAAKREGRYLVEEEVQAMVAVDHDGDVGLVLLEPGLGRLIAVDEALPVRLLREAVGDGIAHCRDMRNGDASDDLSHSSNPRSSIAPLPALRPRRAACPGAPVW